MIPKGSDIPCIEVTSFEYNTAEDFVVHVNVGDSNKYGFYNFHHVDNNRSLLEIKLTSVVFSNCNKKLYLHQFSEGTVLCLLHVTEACEIWSLGIGKYHYWYHQVHPQTRIVTPVQPNGIRRVEILKFSKILSHCYHARLVFLAAETPESKQSYDALKSQAEKLLHQNLLTNVFTVDEDMVYTENVELQEDPNFDNIHKELYSKDLEIGQ